jgi:pimeloyl-ACP methyl ester carboxylesterase
MRYAAAVVALATLFGAGAGMAAPRRQAGPDLQAAYDYDASIPLEASEDPPKVEGEFTTQRVVFASTYGDWISALLVSPTGVLKPPVLLEMHGLACSKDDARNWAQIVGRLGVAVFAIDMPFHGERAQDSTDWQAFRDKRLGPLARRHTVLDNLRALDYLRTRDDLDPRQMALLGGSMGAVLGGIVAGLDTGLAGACLISGSAAPGPQPGTYAPLSDPAQADVDVTNYLGRIAPRRVLIMSGDADRGVPIPYAEALYAAARDPRELFIYAGGHVPGPEVMEGNGGADKIRQWLTSALREAAASAGEGEMGPDGGSFWDEGGAGADWGPPDDGQQGR